MGIVAFTAPLPVCPTMSVEALTNVAETGAPPPASSVHAPAPLQPPPHPWKTHPDAGCAWNDTVVPATNPATHVSPQLIPGGTLTTDPEPETLAAICWYAGFDADGPNTAVAAPDEPAVTGQTGPLPVQAPLHPTKYEPGAGVAVSTTSVPWA